MNHSIGFYFRLAGDNPTTISLYLYASVR